jgi:hypothetical protein
MRKNLLILMLCIVSAAEGATFLSDYADPTNGISITSGFIPDATRVILSEPLFLTFVVSNHADQPFQFSFFGDSNFTITATNAAGMPAKNLNQGRAYGGAGKKVSVLRGDAYTERLLLNNWCGIDQPGDYAVTCRYTFRNYSTGGVYFGPAIVNAFQLTVLPSDPKRVSEIIAGWGQVVETNGSLHEAVLALAAINDSRTIPYLAVLVMKGSDINYIAAHALARFTNNLAAADALTDALKNGDEHMIYVPQVASTALRNFHQSDRAARTLLPGLTNPDANVRIQTARAISWTGSELAFGPVCSLLQDESNEVSFAAAEAIGRLGDARSFAVLTNCLTNADFAMRIAAVKGLHVFGRQVEPSWVKPMILSGGENIRTYYDAIDLLRMYGGDLAAPGLASCLHFDDPSVRHAHNMRLMLALEYSPNGPKYYYKWHHDPNSDGTEEELADNRKILSELKAWLARQK